MNTLRASDADRESGPSYFAVVAAVLAAVLCAAGSVLSPLAETPAAADEKLVWDLRVFPDRSGFNVLLLPFFDPRSQTEPVQPGAARVEEQVLNILKRSGPVAAGRMDAEFLLPNRLPASTGAARAVGVRHGADLVVRGRGGEAEVVFVSELPPPGARGPAGYIWNVPRTLPSDSGCLTNFILGAEALGNGFFDAGIRWADRAGESCAAKAGETSAETAGAADFLAASCSAASGDFRAAVKRLTGALYTSGIASAARRNLDLLLQEHFAGFAERRGTFGTPESRLPRSGASVPESAVDILMDNHFQGYKGALRRYYEVVSMRLKPFQARLALGEVLEVVFGDMKGALREYDRARELAPDDFEAAYRAAAVSEVVVGSREAARRFEEASAVRFDPWAAYNLGVLKENVFGDLRGAADLYQQAAEARPDFFEPVRNAALLYRTRLDRPESAREAFEAALKIRPEDAEMHAELGMLLMERFDDPEGAVHHLLASLRSDPSTVGAEYVLAVLLRDELNDPGGARRHYLAAGRINPRLRSAASDRAFYVRAPGTGSDSVFRTSRGRAVRIISRACSGGSPSTADSGILP